MSAMRTTIRLMLPVFLAVTLASAAEDQMLRLAAGGHHQVSVTAPAEGLWEIATTGGDPFVVTVPAATAYDVRATPIFTFDYLCVSGLDHVEIFAGPAWSGERKVDISPLPPREGWSPFSIDLSNNPSIVAAKPTAWRIDFGSQSGRVLQIRNLRLRARSAAELEAAAASAKKKADDLALDATLRAYVQATYPGTITQVVAGADTITVTGSAPSGGEVQLAEWPVWQSVGSRMSFANTWPVSIGGGASSSSFTQAVPRMAEDGSDRVLSRFVLIKRQGQVDTLLSHGRWADVIPAATNLPAQTPRSRKGLGGYSADRKPSSDLDELNIGCVTVNVVLSGLFQAGPGDGAEPLTAGGRTWYLRRQAFDGYDATMRETAKRGIVVLGIILVPPARSWGAKNLGALIQHPDYDPAGIFTMPNLTTAEGAAAYTMMLDVLAKRYSRADGKYGRVHHWIMHNEVDMGWVWTNCGTHAEMVFLEQYYRSLRLAHLILRRQDPSAKAFVTLTHHWTATADPAHCYPSRVLLDDLLAFGRAEGDFDWGIAYHPYPASLLEPKTWRDHGADFRLDTPKITFRNIEVLDAWVSQPQARYLGKQIRTVHLSEQGPNSPDYSPTALAEQAAAMAYIWKKMSALDTIAGFEFHNWIDNRHEGGLRIGLRRFPDDEQEPLGAKPVWHVYKALGSADEDRACEFAKPIIGIKDWVEVVHTGPIPATQ